MDGRSITPARRLDAAPAELSSERLITNRLGFNKNSLNPACGGCRVDSNPVGVRAQFETPPHNPSHNLLQ